MEKELNTGWRLPTMDELEVLHGNMDAIGGFDPSSWYWSDTEANYDAAWIRRFSVCRETIYVKSSNRNRVRCVRSIALNELSGKGIAKDVPIGERFDLDGDKVVFGGIDENSHALIVALRDEPGPRGNYEMDWKEATRVAEMKKIQEKIEIRININDALSQKLYNESLEEWLIDNAEDVVEQSRPGFHEEDVDSTTIHVEGGNFVVRFVMPEQEPKINPKLPRM